jgi:hypothetical protein
MKKLIYLNFLFIFLGIVQSKAQDKIYKKGGEVIEVKIIEIGVDEIKYRLYNVADGPIYTIEKDRIIKVVYNNGRIESYASAFNDVELYADQRNQALKINFLSPLFGFTAFSYEKSVKPGRSYELTLGIIGLGKRQKISSYYDGSSSTPIYRRQSGVYVSGGYKFIKLPDFTSRGSKFTHIMQGTYIKPELMFGLFSANRYYYSYGNSGNTSNYKKKTTVFGGAIINLGKQWVFSDVFVLDIYAGAGYDINNEKSILTNTGTESVSYEYSGYHYGMASTTNGTGLGLTGGIRIGIMLGKKPTESKEEKR